MSEVLISIVIPAYNEEKRISETLQSIGEYCDKEKLAYEIIVVNDGSKDKTLEIVKSLGIKNLLIVDYPNNGGKGYAVNQGVEKAQGKYILFMDADNSTKIDNLAKFLKAAEETEVVIASRYISESDVRIKQPFYRRWIARSSNFLIQLMVLPGIEDTQCGFKLFRHNEAKKIFARQTIYGWGFDMEILTIAKTLGYKIKEMPVDWYNNSDSKVRAIRSAIRTLGELLKIKKNQLIGRYAD